MKISTKIAWVAGVLALSSFYATPNYASLVTFQVYNGNVGVSTDGASETRGVLSASAPVGSTVLAAYLYTSTYLTGYDLSNVQLNGSTVTYGPTFVNGTDCCNLASHRADVTSIVSSTINGGVGGVYNFSYSEGSGGVIDNRIDGSALVVVYSNPILPEATVGILNGSASVTGDSATIAFANPLDPNAAGFFADMFLGIGFSCCEQKSTVEVNGTLMTENAGNMNDGVPPISNGELITVGSFDDPYSPSNPSYEDDTEKYDLSSFISTGDLSILIETANASEDDNIFLAVFHVSGEATISTGDTPLPAAAWLFASVLGAGGYVARRRRKGLTKTVA